MELNVGRSILIIAVCVLCTLLERALPFLVFRGREVPGAVRYLGGVLPMAVMATLVVYCLRDTAFTSLAGFAPQAIAVAVVVGLHLWRRSALMSIVGGTAVYMVLVQMVF